MTQQHFELATPTERQNSGADLRPAAHRMSIKKKPGCCRASLMLLACRYSPRSVSFRPPTVFWTLPAVFCALPSASVLLSPVALPATSFALPLACSHEPCTRSLSIVPSPSIVGGTWTEQRLNQPDVPVQFCKC